MNDTKESVALGLSAVGLTLVGFAVVIVLVFVGWRVGWWFTVQNQKHQATLLGIQNRQVHASSGYQESTLAEISNNLNAIGTLTVEIAAMPASQRAASEALRYTDVQQLCSGFGDLSSPSELPAQTRQFVSIHCIGSAANPATRNSSFNSLGG